MRNSFLNIHVRYSISIFKTLTSYNAVFKPNPSLGRATALNNTVTPIGMLHKLSMPDAKRLNAILSLLLSVKLIQTKQRCKGAAKVWTTMASTLAQERSVCRVL